MVQRTKIMVPTILAFMTASPAFAAVSNVPEPGSLSLMAAGVAATAIAFRFRKKK